MTPTKDKKPTDRFAAFLARDTADTSIASYPCAFPPGLCTLIGHARFFVVSG